MCVYFTKKKLTYSYKNFIHI